MKRESVGKREILGDNKRERDSRRWRERESSRKREIVGDKKKKVKMREREREPFKKRKYGR